MGQKTYQLMVPCHFGLEAVVKREIYDLGYETERVEDGRVTFLGDAEAVCRANIFLRTAERVLLLVGRFRATTFEELFDGILALPWEEYIPVDGKFWVKKASTVKSKLFAQSDIQSVAKKAMVKRLSSRYRVDWFKEDGADYPVRIFLFKDEAIVALDTTGESLHKRGYRTMTSRAPLSETLAASLLLLTPWQKERILIDPFCGSGTIPIEAAMMAAGIAPGMNRRFTAEAWTNLISPDLWTECFDEARENVDINVDTDIQGYDIDGEIIAVARENAKRAGVAGLIHFQERDITKLHHSKKYGFLVTNPPYGERMDASELPKLYREIGEAYRGLKDWSMFLISGYADAERYIGKKADKNRKIYNGMLKTYFYSYMGAKPPKRQMPAQED